MRKRRLLTAGNSTEDCLLRSAALQGFVAPREVSPRRRLKRYVVVSPLGHLRMAPEMPFLSIPVKCPSRPALTALLARRNKFPVRSALPHQATCWGDSEGISLVQQCISANMGRRTKRITSSFPISFVVPLCHSIRRSGSRAPEPLFVPVR